MSQTNILTQWIKDAENSPPEEVIEEAPLREYSVRLAAWIDILGMRHKIRTEKDAETIFNYMEKLQTYVVNACEPFAKNGKIQYQQISDGFIIASDLDIANEFCEILCRIQWNVLTDSKMLLRGAVTAGSLSIGDDSKLIIGPAFIDAFALEDEIAIYPRIMLSPTIYKTENLAISCPYISKDNDSTDYLDFLKYAIDKYKFDTKRINLFLKSEGVIDFIESEYRNNSFNKMHIAQKYGWMSSKLIDKNVMIKNERAA